MNPIIILVGGGLLFYFLKNPDNPISDGLKKNIETKLEDVLIRSLTAERRIQITIQISVKNNNKIGGQVQKITGIMNWLGSDFSFEKIEPIDLLPEEENFFDFDIFINPNLRGVSPAIKQAYRNGTYEGNPIITGAMETNYGIITFQEKVSII